MVSIMQNGHGTLINATDAAAMLRIGKDTLIRRAKRGQVEYSRLGKNGDGAFVFRLRYIERLAKQGPLCPRCGQPLRAGGGDQYELGEAAG